ncbi:serine/threonine-protein kinase Nek3-like isoform X2 [Clupea harengus]|uniref:non-specific serine/threonine protein kinase n=1 Tax=Clupea harengus TaxID=7950 RepID=A0A6P8GMT6_CLUHA|nr:serine/threonine-protein kinase Nek3-like isoform X2 [Clupea harengus]
MGGVESILRDQGYTVLGEKDGKYLVHLKEGKRFLVEQIEKDKHVEECLKCPVHAHIVETQSFEARGKIYLLMEQCSGGTLYEKIQAQKMDNVPFSEEKVMAWFTKICMALEHLHTDGITHRLLISQNIFFTGCGTVRLGETAELHERARVEKPKHTNAKQPPEVQEGRPYTLHSDIYALGCLLYEMCTLKTCASGAYSLICFIPSQSVGCQRWTF